MPKPILIWSSPEPVSRQCLRISASDGKGKHFLTHSTDNLISRAILTSLYLFKLVLHQYIVTYTYYGWNFSPFYEYHNSTANTRNWRQCNTQHVNCHIATGLGNVWNASGVAVAASVFTLAAMSMDRWVSIAPALRLRPAGRRQALLLLAVLWALAALMFIPLVLVAFVRTEAVPILSHTHSNISVRRTISEIEMISH